MNWNSQEYLKKTDQFYNSSDCHEKINSAVNNAQLIGEQIRRSMNLSTEELNKVIGV